MTEPVAPAPGSAYASGFTVTAADTAAAMESGTLEVLATPKLVALMENAAMLCAAPALKAGDTTVGAYIEVNHLKPSALGATVRAVAKLVACEGRAFDFEIEAHDGDTLVATAKHRRVAVTAERFMAKLNRQN